MEMFRTGVDKQFLDHGVTEFIFREHTLYSDLDETFWLAGADFRGCKFFQTTWVTGVVLVDFYIFLVAGSDLILHRPHRPHTIGG